MSDNIGWQVISIGNENLSWDEAVTYWGFDDYIIDRYIYRLSEQPIPENTSLTFQSWERLDSRVSNFVVETGHVYWVLLESEEAVSGESGGSEGPKVNWKVEFKDILTGDLLYDGDIRTDSNGICTRPSFNSSNDVYEIVFSCVDSSGYDLLTGEQSTVGEKLSAIVEKNSNDYVQATHLSAILVEGLRDSGDVSLDNYRNKKMALEESFGIENMDINPYNESEDSEKALKNSEEIMKISSFFDGMESVLADNSSKSSDEIKREMRKSLFSKIQNFSIDSSGEIDLSSEDFVSDVMGDAGQAVVDNGANIESLKSNSKGIASFVKSIKETIRSNEDGDISTILIEIHKTKKAIKETIKTIRDAGGNFDSDLETDVTNKKGTLDFDNYTNPIYIPPKVFVSPSGRNSFRTTGSLNDPFATLAYAWKRTGKRAVKNICLREGNYFVPQLNINSKAHIYAYPGENVVFNGTKSIDNLKDVNDDWTPVTKTIVTDDNETESVTLYRIKLRKEVKIWQLFHNHEEVINARWPSAQWSDDTVFDNNKWGHGYDKHIDVSGTMRDYDNGEIVDIPFNEINLYDFVEKQKTINPDFKVQDSVINLNVGSFKSYTKIVNGETIDANNNIIRLNYEPVDLWKTKHHYYYLENKLEYLNSENEWYFDNDTKYLYVRLSDDAQPSLNQIRAKVSSYALNINSKSVSIRDINFFGLTLKANKADRLYIKNCNFLYPSCYAHMLGEINRGKPIDSSGENIFENNTRITNSSYCVIDKCAFKYVDGDVLHVTGGKNTLKDSYIGYVDKTVCDLSSVMTTLRFGGERNLIRNNTIHKTAASSTINPGDKSIVELNNLYETGYLQSDGSMIHLMVNQQLDAKIRYNWVHDTIKYGIRCDGEGAGNGAYIHHNIGWNCNGGIMVKGGELDGSGVSVGGHYVYNNTFFNSVDKNDIMALNTQSGVDINYGTVVMNNLCENLSGHRSDPEPFEARIIASNNYNPSDVEPYLMNYNNCDFRPMQSATEIVNQGSLVPPSNDFKPYGQDRLTRDIGAMTSNWRIWKGGITWNRSLLSDEEYIQNKRFSFMPEDVSGDTSEGDTSEGLDFADLIEEYSLLPTESKTQHDVSGVIGYVNLEGGFYGITTADNQKYLPINLQNDLKEKNGKIIHISGYSNADAVSIFMWGTLLYVESWNIEEATIQCLTKSSSISVVNSNGPKYLFNGLTAYDPEIKFGLSEGIYTIQNIPVQHPMAILNAGRESQIFYTGDPSKKSARMIWGKMYHFYHGDITITVTSDFGEMSVISRNHGFMGGGKLLAYSSQCVTEPEPEPLANIVCLINPSNVNIINSNGLKYIFNGLSNYVSDRQFGLYNGVYTIKNVPWHHPMALLNAGKETKISYTGHMSKRSMKWIAGHWYPFYHGDITITVTSDFGEMSIICRNHGYMGGENLLIYSSQCIPNSPNYIIAPNVPNWLQPSSYSAIIDPNYSYLVNFNAWCSPTSAANQLGHLVDIGLLHSPSHINDMMQAGLETPHSSPASTFTWDTAHGWGDYLLDGPTYRGVGLGNGIVSDFGWYMDTNNMGINSNNANSPVGTTIINIYNGMLQFYSDIGWTSIVGIAYHSGQIPTYKGKYPEFWLNNGYDSSITFDRAVMFSTIRHEIDNNRTIMACYNGWPLVYISNYAGENADAAGAYYKFHPSPDNPNTNNETGETYTITIPDGDGDAIGGMLGHTVLIVGYIPAGSLEDIHGSTDWLIVRDNQPGSSGAHRNVIVPYYDHLLNDSTGWDKILATLFVNPALGTYSEVIQQPEPEPEGPPAPTILYVSGGSTTNPTNYNFYSDSAGTNEVTTLYLDNISYEFRRLNDATTHPFYISDSNNTNDLTAQPSTKLIFSGDGNYNSGITDSESFTVDLSNITSGDIIYAYCTAHPSMYDELSYTDSPDQGTPFNLNFGYTDSVSDPVKQQMQTAVLVIEEIIGGYAPDIADIATRNVTIDEANLTGNTLGQAWPSIFKIVINTTNSGNVGLATKNGTIFVHINVVVLIHEIIHILGIGTNINAWYNNLVYSPPNGERRFYTGTNGVREYKAILDTNGYVYGGITGIPVEDDFGAGTVNSHFEEGYDDDAEHNFTNLEYVYDGEGVQHPTIPRDIMTGFIEMDVNEISGITLGVLEDVGYYVNYGSQYCVYAVHLQFEN